jgi:Fic family protein
MARNGQYILTSVAGEAVRAYVPAPLPPDPPLDLAPRYSLIDRANQALGRLDGVSALLPDASLFLYLYIRKEALLSSQIEGTQSSFADLLLFEGDEAPNVPLADVEEVSNYVAAINHGLRRMAKGFPLSLRLLREIHAVLLRGGRGAGKLPGEFRRSQNWIGGTRPGNAVFVPPPATHLDETLSALEKFLHDRKSPLPVLVRAALAHAQFETIHPFLDGNGRLGRLLITLLLCNEGALRAPTLYLSLYLKMHRARYYELLNAVRLKGAWEEWLDFFLEGVVEVADQAANDARRILDLFEVDRKSIQSLGRRAPTIARVHAVFQRHPLAATGRVAAAAGLSFPAASKAIQTLTEMKILNEITGRKRDRIHQYTNFFKIINEGASPL